MRPAAVSNAAAGERRRSDLSAAAGRPFVLTASRANGRVMSAWLAVGGCYVTRSGRARAMFAAAG